jgi:hypothetical protein
MSQNKLRVLKKYFENNLIKSFIQISLSLTVFSILFVKSVTHCMAWGRLRRAKLLYTLCASSRINLLPQADGTCKHKINADSGSRDPGSSHNSSAFYSASYLLIYLSAYLPTNMKLSKPSTEPSMKPPTTPTKQSDLPRDLRLQVQTLRDIG